MLSSVLKENNIIELYNYVILKIGYDLAIIRLQGHEGLGNSDSGVSNDV
jgi:hypothetical protein